MDPQPESIAMISFHGFAPSSESDDGRYGSDGLMVFLPYSSLSWGSVIGTVGILTHRIYQTHTHEEHPESLTSMIVICLALAGLLLNLGLLADSKVIALPFVFGALSFIGRVKRYGDKSVRGRHFTRVVFSDAI